MNQHDTAQHARTRSERLDLESVSAGSPSMASLSSAAIWRLLHSKAATVNLQGSTER